MVDLLIDKRHCLRLYTVGDQGLEALFIESRSCCQLIHLYFLVSKSNPIRSFIVKFVS